MSVREKSKHILAELKGHIPFTLFGAALGIIFMLIFRKILGASGHKLFTVFHPGHVILSAMVTASMFGLHATRKRFVIILVVGYLGSIGIATLSDIVIPHIGTKLFSLDIPTHMELHSEAEHVDHEHHEESEAHKSSIHLSFIEDWYIINPAAILGVIIAFFIPRTKFPHAGHVLISTWASSSYLMMSMESAWTVGAVAGIFITLFVAVWLPCCISDIVFPLLFVKSDLKLGQACQHHWLHSHAHQDKQESAE
jgi:hypothetical protein